MNTLRSIVLLCVVAALVTGCNPAMTLAPLPAAPPPDVIARAATLKPMDMSQSPLLGGLADWERAVLNKLLQAARTMDAAFWQQVDPDGEAIFRSLAGAATAPEKAARFLLDANYGRWDRFQEFAPFMGNLPRPAGGYVYPPDLTKKELDAYLVAHPDQKDALLDPFTIVRRAGDRLVAVPYHKAYAAYVLPAADLLDEAATLSRSESLTNYLRLEAQALRTDDYFAANMAWLDLNANLDVSIGPHETYDDQLTGQKAFYKANVLIVDRAAGGRLAKFMATVPALQANLPVPPAFRPDQAGTMTPLELADDIYRSGQSRAIMEPVAFSLPNDPKVWEAKGAKKVMMRNYLEARRTIVLTPLVHAIVDEQTAQLMDAETYFNWVLLHEVTHTLGPRTVKKDGQDVTIRQALGQNYSPVEEGKADIGGLYNVPYLREQGIITGTLASHYAGFLAESLRSIRFGPGSAYGLIRSAAWNFFVERGALRLEPARGRFILDVERMTAAVKELAATLITIEGQGDAEAAAAFLAKYAPVKPELQKLLDKAGETVPIEFVPIYARPAGTTSSSALSAAAKDAGQAVVYPAKDAALAGAAPAGKTPLKDALPTLEPTAVWENFYALTQIPRPSHHEAQVSRFVADFGKKLGLETTVDEVGNVLIRQPATPGMEQRQGVIFQAHMDMVPQKTPDKMHDFEKDPIQAYVEGGWVKADRTTLGADDGIGVATIMAILQAKDLAHGPIEAFFTVDEEDSFSGVNALKPGALKGSAFINVDWETEGSFAIGSAGGVYVDGKATYTEEKTPAGMAAYRLGVKGLQGGHSGIDINKGRGSAGKLLARLLWSAGPQLGVRVAMLVGGDRYNAIPREATALVVVPTEQADALAKYVQEFERTVRVELAATDPDLAVRATPTDLPAAVMDAKVQQALINAVYGCPNGVIRMSDGVPGLVEASSSMGILKAEGGKFIAGMYVRSAVDSARDDLAQRLQAVFRLAGAEATTHDAYGGWRPNPNSAILGVMKQAFKARFGADPGVAAIHAGLETSVVGVTYPSIDMISVGPTLVAVHSPDERLEVASVKKVYDLLVETLKRIPEQK
jgi:dipeptidase D